MHSRPRGVRPRNSRRADNSRSAGHSDPLDPRMEARRRDPGIIRLQQTVMKKTAAEAAARPSTNLWKQGFVFTRACFLNYPDMNICSVAGFDESVLQLCIYKAGNVITVHQIGDELGDMGMDLRKEKYNLFHHSFVFLKILFVSF